MAVELICVRRFYSSFEANVALAKLSQEGGILAFLENEEEVLVNTNTLLGNIKLMINPADLEAANAILGAEEEIS